MSEPGLEVIDSTVHKTHEWIAAVAETGHLGKAEAFKALRAVLQTLRDRLPVDDAVHFAAELPLLIRGIFFEGWRPSQVPRKLSREEFLESVREKIVTRGFLDPVRVTSAVLEVITAHLPDSEKTRRILPADIQSLWPMAAAGS